MAAPVDSARQNTNITTAATSHAINVGSPVAGTLLIVMVRFAAAPGTVTFTGYTQFATDSSDASDDTTSLYYRWADGTEGATDTLSTTNSVKLAAISWEITGAENPATTAPSVSSVVVGTAANINPGAVAPLMISTLDLSVSTGEVLQGSGGLNEEQAFGFTSIGTVINQVQAKLDSVGTPGDNLVVEIQSDSANKPSNTVLTTVATVMGSTITGGSFNTYTWDLEAPLAVTNATRYWVVLRRSGSRDTSNYYRIASSGVSGTADYFNGDRDSGTWNSGFTDYIFSVSFGAAAKDYLFLTVIGMDSETATFTSPSGYSTATTANSGTGGAVATNCMIAGASKQATAVTSDDPGAWTSSAPNAGVTAWTIVISPPAAAAAPGPAAAMFKPPLRRRASRYLTFR